MCKTTDHVYTKEEVLNNIASATNAAQIVGTMASVDDVYDDDVFAAFLKQVTAIAGKTTDPEDLGLLREKLVTSNLSVTNLVEDNKVRKVILLQLIATATSTDYLGEINDEVVSLADDDVIAAYDAKLASLT